MLTRSAAFLAICLATLPGLAAKDKPLDIQTLIDLSGFNFAVTGVRTANDNLQLDAHNLSIKDEYKKDHHYVVVSLHGKADRSGSFILVPDAFIAEYLRAESWCSEGASAVGVKMKLMGGREQTFWAQRGLAVTISMSAIEKGGEYDLELVFVLPRDVTAIKVGTARFIPETVQIRTP